jgi:hypothetical protein
MQLDGEGCQLLGWESTEERFQQYLGLAHARIEIVMEAIEQPPTGGRLYGRGAGDVVSYFVEFTIQPLECVAKDPQLMEKARALSKEHVVQEAVPGGSALSGVTPEEVCLQRFDGWKVADVLAATDEGLARGNKPFGEAPQESRSHRDLLARTNQLSPRPERECLVQSDTHHGIRAFPAAYDGIEYLTLVPRQSCNPIVSHASPGGEKLPYSP